MTSPNSGGRRIGHRVGYKVGSAAAATLTALAISTTVAPTSSAAESTSAAPTSSTRTSASTATSQASSTSCVDIYALSVQGTGQSSPGVSAKANTGFLGGLFNILSADLNRDDPDKVARFDNDYIDYDASMGGFGVNGVTPTAGAEDYTGSVAGGLDGLTSRAAEILVQCPDTKLFTVGYSQGADVVDQFLAGVGSGSSPIPADAIAGGAVFGSPRRGSGIDILPGGGSVPTGPEGEDLDLPELTAQPATGSGLLPPGDQISDYGVLAGRVANFCSEGDLVCATADKAPAARATAKMLANVDLTGGDPFKSLTDLSQALTLAPAKTAVDVVNEDVSGDTLDTVEINPSKSISARLEEATSPTTPTATATAAADAPADLPGLGASLLGGLVGGDGQGPSPQESMAALTKLGMLGLDTMVTVARETFTPSTIASVASVGLSDPAAGLAVLGTRAAASATKVLAPVGVKAAEAAFEIASQEVEDNSGLIQMATDVKYWTHAAAHTSYGAVPVAADGSSALDYTADWISALLDDSEATSTSTSASETESETSTTTQTSTSAATTTSETEEPSESASATSTTRSSSRSASATSTRQEEPADDTTAALPGQEG